MDCNVSVFISILLRLIMTVSHDKLIRRLHRHLHSELRKISRKIDLIFGTQMTMEMGCYFAQIALVIQEIFNVIFIKDYNNQMYYVILLIVWLLLNIFRLFLINYECDKVSIKVSIFKIYVSKT